MKLKKFLAVVLAAVLTLSLAACSSPDVKWIATVNDEKIPSGIYLALMMNAYYEAADKLYPAEVDPRKEEIEGKDGAQWIQERTDELFKMYLAIDKKAKEMNVVFDAETQMLLKQQIDYQWQYLGAVYEKNGISYESFTEVSENTYKATLLFHSTYGVGGTEEIPAAELLKTFQNEFYKVQQFTLDLADAEGKELDEAGQKAVNDKAAELVTKLSVAGADFNSIVLEYEKELAKANGEEESSVHTHEADTHTYFIEKTSEAYDKELLDTINAMKNDEVRTLTIGTSVYVLKRLDSAASTPAELEDYRTAVMNNLKADEFRTNKQAWADAAEFTYVEDSKATYTPSKLKI